MNFDQFLGELAKLNLPIDQYVVVSSGSLAVRGIRDARDLDVIVADKLWHQLSQQYPVIQEGDIQKIDVGTKDIEILGAGSAFQDSSIASVDELIDTADVIGGIRFINLQLLKRFKQKMGRDKDLKDIELIDQYLVKQNQN